MACLTDYKLGAGLGAPVGGLLADTVGWRTAFLMQVPIVLVSMVLVFTFVKYQVPGQSSGSKASLKRIDWSGSLTLILAVRCDVNYAPAQKLTMLLADWRPTVLAVIQDKRGQTVFRS